MNNYTFHFFMCEKYSVYVYYGTHLFEFILKFYLKKTRVRTKIPIQLKISLQLITTHFTISCVTLFVLCKQRPELSLWFSLEAQIHFSIPFLYLYGFAEFTLWKWKRCEQDGRPDIRCLCFVCLLNICNTIFKSYAILCECRRRYTETLPF